MAEREKCKVCEVNLYKYKCPVCLIKYCCVACFKKHRAGPDCIKPEVPTIQKTTESPIEVIYETEDTVKPEKLNLLGSDRNVRQDLKNRHLRKLLEHINSSQNPSELLEKAMKEPLFVEFAEHCIEVVDEESYINKYLEAQ